MSGGALAGVLERLVADRPVPSEPEPPEPGSGPGGNPPPDHGPSPLVLLIVALLVVGGGYFLSVKLRDLSRIQDCVMQGRTNCATIDPAQLR
jgi:hypothetical protein